jgi:hypothetical protein
VEITVRIFLSLKRRGTGGEAGIEEHAHKH